ncbi:histidinol dehydrogenase [Alphaproteobacteria bacterium]|nr:histidinol dehydrogenase [Alphaproteobacteria bacterium]
MQVFCLDSEISHDLERSLPQKVYNFLHQNYSYDIETNEIVKSIIEQVKNEKDHALVELSNKFDKANFKNAKDFVVDFQEIQNLNIQIDERLKLALDTAFQRIDNYHRQQLPLDFFTTDESGMKLGNVWQAIEKIGVYVPAGSASYPSSVLMSIVPAIVAGVKEVYITTPLANHQINPAILYCAKICQVKKIYKIGGAQAISALAFGTPTISKVDKIVGPGNSFVALAKKQLYGEVGIDMIAGPSDVSIIAENFANPKWIAIDALSQLEHGIDSKAFIFVDDMEFANKIIHHINDFLKILPRRKIIEESLKNSAIFVLNNLLHSSKLINFIAPEHLQIIVKNHSPYLEKISNAGAIFIGEYTPEAIGDYIAGPSHTLPTSANARFASGLSVYDFLKRRSIMQCDKKSFQVLASHASAIANCEGLTAHQLSIDIRNL